MTVIGRAARAVARALGYVAGALVHPGGSATEWASASYDSPRDATRPRDPWGP